MQVEAAPRRQQKSDAAFRTISEVSEDLDIPQHVLRFWESRFPNIKPLKRGGGRRYYRPEDVQLLRRIRDLLYKDGYTIRGVQKLLREPSRGDAGPADGGESAPDMQIVLPVAEAIAPPPRAPAPRVEPAPAIPVARSAPIVPSAPVTAAERPSPSPQPGAGISGARRALLETLLAEIDELRGLLDTALKKEGG